MDVFHSCPVNPFLAAVLDLLKALTKRPHMSHCIGHNNLHTSSGTQQSNEVCFGGTNLQD